MENNKKDNPVPSLKEELCQFGLYLGDNFKKLKNQNIDNIVDNYLKENGVETDNEQPKCKCCSTCECD